MRSLALLALLALLAGCAAPAGEAPPLVATFYPLSFAAERLAGEDVPVGTLVPGDIEPHDWEPSPVEVTRLAKARLVLAQGAGFEPWLGGLMSNLGEAKPRVVDTTEPSMIVEDDPHTWIAPRLYARQVALASAAIQQTWPEHAANLSAREETLVAELHTLHAEYEEGLRTCEARVIIANHDAYGYLGREYGFEIVALSGLSPEAEPTPDAIAHAVEVAREHNITVIYFEELVSPRVAQVVASEVGATTRVLSPIEGAPDEGDVLTLMRENLVALREGMRCT